MWSLFILVIMSLMFSVTLPSITIGYDIPLAVSVSERSLAETGIPFPTLTLCPVQKYDMWNVPRLLLNDLAFACKKGRCPKVSQHLEGFVKEFVRHAWMSPKYTQEVAASDPDFAAAVDQVARHVVKSRSPLKFEEAVWRHLRGDLPAIDKIDSNILTRLQLTVPQTDGEKKGT